MNQGAQENRGLAETLDRAWQVLASLPRRELTMLPARFLDTYYPGGAAAAEPAGPGAGR